MSLLDDLQALDLSAVTNARGSISVTMNGADLKAVLDGGAAQAALGDLGKAIAELRDAFRDPASLVQPLAGGLGQLAGGIDPGELPVADFIDAVGRGGRLLADLAGAVHADPEALHRLLDTDLDDLLGAAATAFAPATRTLSDEVAVVADLIHVADAGLPRDPRALADVALRLLVPGGTAPLAALRRGIDDVVGVSAALVLPAERVGGLVVALDAVAAAATANDGARLQRALDDLGRIRSSTVASVGDELVALAGRLDALHLDALVPALSAAAGAIHTVEGGVLDLVARLRALMKDAREIVGQFDAAVIADAVPKIFDFLEETARREIVAPIDALVARLQQWLRDLLAALPLRALRQKLRDAFHAVAEKIASADLGRYGDEVRAKLAPIGHALDGVDLPTQVQGALQSAAQKVRQALDQIDGALNAIKTAVNAVAAQAAAVLQRGADALATFKTEMDRITAAVDQLGIEDAAQAVIKALSDLREKAQELLAKAPLPEPLRPLVEQLVHQVEAIDLDSAILGPVHAATAELRIGPTLEGPIKAGLGKLRDALDQLIPAQLIASIQAEIGAALDRLRAFDPASLVGELGKYVEDAAKAIEALDPATLVAEIRKPFTAVLGLVDAMAPDRLLEPAFRAWDASVGALALPGPDKAVAKATALIGGAGDGLRRAALEPVRQLAPGAEVVARDPAAPRTSAPAGPLPADVRVGDVMRVLGFLPARLHAALSALEAEAAGEVVQALHAVGGGLAADLRRVLDVVWGLEAQIRAALDDALAPLAAAEARADMALRAHVAGGGVTIDVDVAFDAVYAASPARLRDALLAPLDAVVARAHAAAEGLAFGTGDELDRVAHRLEASPLAAATASLDALRTALDVEPLAAEFEALVLAALQAARQLLPAAEASIDTALSRLRALVNEFNPATQLLKFLSVLDVLRTELDLLNPRRIAADLGEVHAVIKQALSAYDPAGFAAELTPLLTQLATKLRALNPAQLLGDLSVVGDLKAKIDAVDPAKALAGVGDALKDVGAKLAALDPASLLAAVDAVPQRIDDAFAEIVRQIKQEIIALLESIKYVGGSVSASASGSVGGGSP